MKTLKTPSRWNYTPAWRAEMWRSETFKIHAPLDRWHPKARDGEWYHVGYPREHPWMHGNIIDGWGAGAYNSWRRGIWTGGRHEAEARAERHLWWWWTQ